MTGIFRDYVIRGSYLHYYINEGTRSYSLVSKFDLQTGKGNPRMFTRLSNEFEFYSGALDYMRKVYFHADTSGDPFSDFVYHILFRACNYEVKYDLPRIIPRSHLSESSKHICIIWHNLCILKVFVFIGNFYIVSCLMK